MQTFIQKVTEDIVEKLGTDLSDVVVVFPNKRASLFMNQHLMTIVKRPMFTPQYMTIGELFHSKSNLTVADSITSVCTLYKTYLEITLSSETIDEFWSWGEVMLSDFDDIDKHLGDPVSILRNVSELHSYDSIDYLTTEQREALKRFFSNITDDKDSELKGNFTKLWDKLLPIYEKFNADMKAQHLAYEGAIYRDVAQHAAEIVWEHRAYVFVGFNMLWETEQELFSELKKKKLSRFYWDYDNYYAKDPRHEAWHYLSKWTKLFPNELNDKDCSIYDNLAKEKDITYISASSENIQARYISKWLKKNKNMRLADKESTAIVLADESLLKSVIHYLPQEVSGKANITIGFPLSETPVASFVDSFIFLHIYCFNTGELSYTLRQVKKIIAHPYVSMLLADEGKKPKKSFSEEIIARKDITIAKNELCFSEVTRLIFEPIDTGSKETNLTLLKRLLTLLRRIGQVSEKRRHSSYNDVNPDSQPPSYEEQMKQESVFQMHNRLNRLHDILSKEKMQLEKHTLRSLIGQITANTTMPFHGEPIADLQITGMLETRNLDFKHLLLISCNEGNIPRGVLSPSLLPYVVRKAHGLTTPEDKVAVYAYYFYRLLQRCNDISIAFNASTEDGKTGEMSRFMLQLMTETTHNNLHFHNITLTANQSLQAATPEEEVKKDERIMGILNDIHYLSPSAINQYMRCPMHFYFEKIVGLKGPDSDNIEDSRTFGSVFHKAAEYVYKDFQDTQSQITEKDIEALLNDNATLQDKIDEAFKDEMFGGKKPHYDGLMHINRNVINRFIRLLLEADKKRSPFIVKEIEKPIYGEISFEVDGKKRSIKVGGIIDRLDQDTEFNRLQVIDYKTGSKMQEVLAGVEEVFDVKKIEECHSDYYLQAMLYSWLVRNDLSGKESLNKENLPVQPILIFVQREESRNEPVLKFMDTEKNQHPIDDIKKHEKEYLDGLRRVIAEIFNQVVPFRTTQIKNSCTYCDFKTLCHKEDEDWN